MSDTPDMKQKAPARPPDDIVAEIEKERAALGASFEGLRGELDELADAGTRRVREVGRKAVVVAPIVAGAVVTTLGAVMMRRRRSGKEA